MCRLPSRASVYHGGCPPLRGLGPGESRRRQTRSPRSVVTLYVAPTKAAKGESLTCKTAKYYTIPAALKAAKTGDIVEVLLDNGGTHKVIKVMIEKNTIAFDF